MVCTRPFGYHLTNLVLHAIVVVLLFLWLRRLLDDAGAAASAEEGRRATHRGWAAFAGAALFAVHPMQAETAGYVSARSELLCGTFLLATLLLTRRAKNVGGTLTVSRRWMSAAGALACGVLAMLSKEVAAALPVLVVAYDWLVLPGTSDSKRRRLMVVFLPLAILTVVAVLYRVRSLAGIDASLAKQPLLNLLTQAIVVWRYLGMMIVPVNQAIMHAHAHGDVARRPAGPACRRRPDRVLLRRRSGCAVSRRCTPSVSCGGSRASPRRRA